LNNDYKIINYHTFQYTQDIYFTNSITIVLLTNIKYTNFLINNIYFSIYIPNIKFSNSQLIDYFKINGIITNTNIKFPNISSKNILNGLVGINISYLTKSQDIKKFIKLINNFINLKLHKIINIKKKKHIQFCNPEYIVLSTPFNAKNEGPLKSILKK
jgi:biotin-(acetyl-CoA carboxylase) ligase